VFNPGVIVHFIISLDYILLAASLGLAKKSGTGTQEIENSISRIRSVTLRALREVRYGNA